MSAQRLGKTSTIICVTLGILLLIYVYFNPVILLSATRWKARGKPELWIVPKPLADVSIKQTAGQTFALYGYQFEVPWTEVKREERLKSIHLVFFSNGFVLMLRDPAQTVDQLKLLTRVGTENEASLKRIFGEGATRSNYALRSGILNLTPSDLCYPYQGKKWSTVQFC
jgi:hypothetical protein